MDGKGKKMKSLTGRPLVKSLSFIAITFVNLFLILAVTVLDSKMKGIIWSDIDGLTIIEKLLFVITVCCVEWAVIYKYFLEKTRFKAFFRNTVLILLLMLPMLFNFITGRFVSGGERMFVLFQADSE